MSSLRSGFHVRHLLLILGALGFVGLGVAIEGCESLEPTRQSMQAKFAHRSAFPGNRTLRLFNRMGVVHSTPVASVPRAEQRVTTDLKHPETLAFWGAGCCDSRPPPSLLAVPASLVDSKVPIVSIFLEKAAWRTLRNRPQRRGRVSESSAYLTFFDQGDHVFSSGAGVRPHGGRSRSNRESNSYRIYLRDTYGADRFPVRLLSGSQVEPLRRVVLRPDRSFDNLGNEWHLVTPLAYDIARRAGARAPLARPVVLVVNGQQKGLYVVVEYLDETYLESMLGHSRFTLVRTKLDSGTTRFKTGDLDGYRDFLSFAKDASKHPLSETSQRVDLENLSRWFVSMMICGNSDAFQGPLVHDDSTPAGRWFWISWDMDNCFMSAGKLQTSTPWEFDVFEDIVTKFHRDPRNLLLRTLIRDQPDFRAQLLETYVEIMNHRVTEAFLAERVSHYESMARSLGLAELESFDRYRTFLAKRAPIVRDRMGSRLGAGSSHRVEISIPPGWAAEVDGFLKNADYAGWYYSSTPLRLNVPADHRARFKHWLVGDRLVSGPRVEIDVENDIVISPVIDE